MRIDVFIHNDEAKLDEALSILRDLKKQGGTMSAELDALTAQVSAMSTVEKSAVALIQGLADQIAAAGTDRAALAALTASLQSQASDLAAAVSANTPAAPPSP